MRAFEFLAPKSVGEVCKLLNQYRSRARVLAGGTEMVVKMKQNIENPDYLVDLKGIAALKGIRWDKGAIRIGALATLSEIEKSELIRERFAILSRAASKVGSPQIRNRGTIGGNICLDSRCFYYNQSSDWKRSMPLCIKSGGEVCYVARRGNRCFAVCSADTVPALIALKAKIRIASSLSEQVIELDKFYKENIDGKSINKLEENQLVTELEVPGPPPHTSGVYLKISQRKAFDFPIASVAVVVGLDETATIFRDIRIILAAVSSKPIRASEAEEVLRGKEIRENLIRESSRRALEEARPLSNAGKAAGYRRMVIPPMVSSAIMQAVEAARSKEGAGNEDSD